MLVTEVAADGVHLVGHTKSYAQVLLPSKAEHMGCTLRVRIEEAAKFYMKASVLEVLHAPSLELTKANAAKVLATAFEAKRLQQRNKQKRAIARGEAAAPPPKAAAAEAAAPATAAATPTAAPTVAPTVTAPDGSYECCGGNGVECACAEAEAPKAATALPPHLRAMADELASGEAQLFDVREPREARMGKLKASILVPLSQLQEGKSPSKKSADPTKLTYLHCAAGVRVHPSKERLEAFGYERVVALQEGFATLANLGFELDASAEEAPMSSSGLQPVLVEDEEDEEAAPVDAAAAGLEATASGAAAACQLAKGDLIAYQTESGARVAAQVIAIHHETSPPYYTIRVNGHEKQTERNRLSAAPADDAWLWWRRAVLVLAVVGGVAWARNALRRSR